MNRLPVAATLLAALVPFAPSLLAQRSHPDFLLSVRCGDCHSAVPSAMALWSATGDDVSPYTLWRGTMMANAFRDPYWQAQVSKEVAANPERGAELQELCITCHAPIAHHRALHAGKLADSIAAIVDDELARDGVSCTVCHQARPGRLGTEGSFGGKLDIQPDGIIWGPFADPATGPMRMQSGYTAVHGPHIRDPGLCASCHTLRTNHIPGGAAFPEQTQFLEWRNSVFAAAGGTDARTCQECHMPQQPAMKIARNPSGLDFNIAQREDPRGHAFVGGNAFMLDLMRHNYKELGMKATGDVLRRTARATRQQLATRTATIAVEGAKVVERTLEFDVRVTNLTGHKLPTGYPSRRAWLRVQVRGTGGVLFTSGNVDDGGHILGLAAELGEPHRAVIDDPAKVPIYELIAHDTAGAATTYTTRMATRGKDNRLLPRGWRVDGPHAEDTAPVGTEGDVDFTAGGDTVRYRVPVGVDGGPLTIVAWFLYQSVPPTWVEALRTTETEEAKRFVRMFDEAEKLPETLALTIEIVR